MFVNEGRKAVAKKESAIIEPKEENKAELVVKEEPKIVEEKKPLIARINSKSLKTATALALAAIALSSTFVLAKDSNIAAKVKKALGFSKQATVQEAGEEVHPRRVQAHDPGQCERHRQAYRQQNRGQDLCLWP